MPIENEDLRLFQIIYAQHADKPMEFVQAEVLKAKEALLANNRIIEAKMAEMQAAKEDTKIAYIEISKADLAIKTRAEIDAAIEDDGITCCLCRKKMKSLGAHLKRVHHVNPKDYIRVCGYPEGTSLMCKEVLAKAQENMKYALSKRLSH